MILRVETEHWTGACHGKGVCDSAGWCVLSLELFTRMGALCFMSVKITGCETINNCGESGTIKKLRL